MSAYSINPADLALMTIIGDDERKHALRLQNAWRRYQGEWPDPLKVPPLGTDYNLKANFARELVDKSVNMLFGREVMFELDDTSRERSDDEQYLDAVWQANRKMSWLQKYATNGGVCGMAFTLIMPADPAIGRDVPKLINLEPEIVWPSWDGLDSDDVWRYKIQFNTTERRTGKPIVRRKDIERDESREFWVVRDYEARSGDNRFVLVAENVWEHPWPPIVHNQNLPAPNEFWGISDLTDDRLDFMHRINMLVSNVNKIIYYDAHKRLYAQGLNAQEDALKEWNIGQIKGLPDGAEVKAVDTSADIAPVLEFIREMKSWLHELANVPEVAVGKVQDIGALSGVALEILYQPLIELTETKRQTYGDALNEINRRLLELDGREAQDTTIQWPDMLPVNEVEQAQTAETWERLGVSSDTLMERAGYDPERERERRRAGDAEFGARLIENQMAGGDAMAVEDE